MLQSRRLRTRPFTSLTLPAGGGCSGAATEYSPSRDSCPQASTKPGTSVLPARSTTSVPSLFQRARISLALPTAMILVPLTATAWAAGRLSSRVMTSPLVKMMSESGGGGGAGGGALGSAGAPGMAGVPAAGAGVAGAAGAAGVAATPAAGLGWAAAGVAAGAVTGAAAGFTAAGGETGLGAAAGVWANRAGAASARPMATPRVRRVNSCFMEPGSGQRQGHRGGSTGSGPGEHSIQAAGWL